MSLKIFVIIVRKHIFFHKNKQDKKFQVVYLVYTQRQSFPLLYFLNTFIISKYKGEHTC